MRQLLEAGETAAVIRQETGVTSASVSDMRVILDLERRIAQAEEELEQTRLAQDRAEDLLEAERALRVATEHVGIATTPCGWQVDSLPGLSADENAALGFLDGERVARFVAAAVNAWWRRRAEVKR